MVILNLTAYLGTQVPRQPDKLANAAGISHTVKFNGISSNIVESE